MYHSTWGITGKGLSLPRSLIHEIFTMISLLIGLGSFSSCSQDFSSEIPIPLKTPLRIGILHTRAALPLSVAQELAYFSEEGIKVELISFESPSEKDTAFEAGTIDCMVSDLVSSTLLFSKGCPLSIVSLVAGGQQQEGRVAILASPGSSIQVADDLLGKEIAISPNTIMDFAVDKLLQDWNLPIDGVVRRSIPKVTSRMEMLIENKIDAAILPEPLVTYAQTKGARVILDDRDNDHCYLTLTVRQEIRERRDDAIERLLIAYNRAVADINVRPAQFRSHLLKLSDLPEEVKDVVRISRYAHWRAPTRGQVAEVLAWLQRRRLVSNDCPYEHLVCDEFIKREDDRCATVWREARQSGKMAAIRPVTTPPK